MRLSKLCLMIKKTEIVFMNNYKYIKLNVFFALTVMMKYI